MTLTRSPGTYRETDLSGALPVDVRHMLAGLVSGAGVLPGSSSPLVQGTASYAYQLNAGWWSTTYGGTYGLHVWGNDGAITVATDAAPGSGLTRIDIIYVLQPSRTESGAADSTPVLGVAIGTPGSPGLAPTIPSGALEVARNTMDSTATSTASAGNTISQTAAHAGTKAIRTGAILQFSKSVTSGGTAATVLDPLPSLAIGSTGYTRTSVGISVPRDGLYTISAQVNLAGTPASGRHFVDVTVSASPVHAGNTISRLTLYSDTDAAGSVTLALSAGTVVGLSGFQSSGVTHTMSGTLVVVDEALPIGW